MLEAFRQQHGASNAVYERLAEARIEELRRKPQPTPCGPGTVEKNGACAAKPASDRDSAGLKAAPPPKRVQDRERREPKNDKPGMCLATDHRVTTLVPCSDPRALTRAY